VEKVGFPCHFLISTFRVRQVATGIAVDAVVAAFLGLTSSDEDLRVASAEQIDGLIDDASLPPLLFSLLSTGDQCDLVYVCAAGCLRLWFQRHWTSLTSSDQLSFVHGLHDLLLIPHPLHRHLHVLYRRVLRVVPDFSPFLNFFRTVLQLISPDLDDSTVIQALSVARVIVRSAANRLNLGQATARAILLESQRRLLPFLSDVSSREDDLIRHALKILRLSAGRFRDRETVRVSFKAMQQVSVPLLRSVGRLLTMYQHIIKDELVLRLAAQFVVEFTDLPRSALALFTGILCESHIEIPIDVLVNVCRLTEAELADFEANPFVFLETAYPTGEELSVRVHAATMVRRLSAELLLEHRPCEEVMFLLAHSECQVRDWALKSMAELGNSLEVATFLFLVASVAECFGEEDFVELQQFVAQAAMGESVVVVCNALRVVREMMERGLRFPVDVVVSGLEFVNIFPEAGEVIGLFVRMQREEAEPIVESVIEQLEVEGSQSWLFVLIELIRGGVVDGRVIRIVAGLAERYSGECGFTDGLVGCFSAVFATEFSGTGLLLSSLIHSLESNEFLLGEIDVFVEPVFHFIVLRTDEFLQLEIIDNVLVLCLDVLHSEGLRGRTENAVSGLLAAVIQLNGPEIRNYLTEILDLNLQNPRNTFQLTASLCLIDQIEFPIASIEEFCDYVESQPLCLYERKLFAATLLAIPHSPETLVPLARSLLMQEREVCDFALPLESLDITDLLGQALSR
jgi:hypothetical protein